MTNLKTIFSGWFLLAFILAAAAHILVGVYAPDSRGYAYDLYVEALYVVSNELRIPNHTDCWICYHPPLYPVIGAAIFKIVNAMGFPPEVQQNVVSAFGSMLSLLLSVYGFLLYLLYRKHQSMDLVLWVLMLFLPVKFVNSFSIEADMLGAALIVAATYHLAVHLKCNKIPHLAACAVFVGLAALTKYTGIVVSVIFGTVLLWRYFMHRTSENLRQGLIFAAVVFCLGGWLYITNVINYETAFPGNAAWNRAGGHWDHYDFTSFGITGIVDAFDPASLPGTDDKRTYWKDQKTIQLWRFPQYNQQVLTSLYGQLWTDFSFFSVKGRHGLFEFQEVFQGKAIPKVLLWGILVAGIVPVVFSIFGFVLLALQREAGLLLGLFIVTAAVYVNWFTGYNIWMLKTKYLLFLFPAWLVFINKFGDLVGGRSASLLVWPAALLSVVYCFVFVLL